MRFMYFVYYERCLIWKCPEELGLEEVIFRYAFCIVIDSSGACCLSCALSRVLCIFKTNTV